MPVRSDAMVKRLTLIACIIGSGIVLLDGTVVNVALPTIQRALGGGLAAQQWVVNGYLLTLGSLILVGGSLGDLFGERRVFALGVVRASASPRSRARWRRRSACSSAARALQGVAGALLVPSSLAVIVNTFPASERGGAIGTWTAWGAIAGVLGPLAGGELLAIASWRWIFVINVPLAAACVVVDPVRRYRVRRRASAGDRRVDFLGALLCALGLGGPVFALIEQPRLGWSDARGVRPADRRRRCCWRVPVLRVAREGPDAAARAVPPAQLLGGQRRDLLDVRRALAVLFFFLVLFLQQIGGYSPLQSGLATLPVTVVMFVLSRRFGALADRFGPRFFMGAGPLVAACGLLLFQRDRGRSRLRLRSAPPGCSMFALGLSMTVAPLTAAVLAGAEKAGGNRLGRQQRDRARRRPARHGRRRRCDRGLVRRRSIEQRLSGTTLGAAARAAVARSQAPAARAPGRHGMPAGSGARA